MVPSVLLFSGDVVNPLCGIIYPQLSSENDLSISSNFKVSSSICMTTLREKGGGGEGVASQSE